MGSSGPSCVGSGLAGETAALFSFGLEGSGAGSSDPELLLTKPTINSNPTAATRTPTIAKGIQRFFWNGGIESAARS